MTCDHVSPAFGGVLRHGMLIRTNTSGACGMLERDLDAMQAGYLTDLAFASRIAIIHRLRACQATGNESLVKVGWNNRVNGRDASSELKAAFRPENTWRADRVSTRPGLSQADQPHRVHTVAKSMR